MAQPVVVSSLDGYNGTVFAYGQTGSGKTFTITGGAEHFVDRGVIPRTISSIFKELATRKGHVYQVMSHGSFLVGAGVSVVPAMDATCLSLMFSVFLKDGCQINLHSFSERALLT